jgi:hypothetical protein
MNLPTRSVTLLLLALLGAVFLAAAACGDDDDDDNGGEGTATGQASETPASSGAVSTSTVFPDNGFQFEISEVGLGESGYVVLTNYTDTPAKLTGLYLCQPPDCVELPDTEVPAEGHALVTPGDGEGLDDVVVTDAALVLSPPDGEVALFAGGDVEDASKIRSYLQWGSTPHEGTAVAIEAGLWIEGSYAPTAESATRLFRNDSGLWLFE